MPVCDHCRAPAFAVAPGSEAPRQFDLFVVERGEAPRAWCEPCWRRAFRVVAVASCDPQEVAS